MVLSVVRPVFGGWTVLVFVSWEQASANSPTRVPCCRQPVHAFVGAVRADQTLFLTPSDLAISWDDGMKAIAQGYAQDNQRFLTDFGTRGLRPQANLL